eukprot:747574-Hanusia_phi.AAC.23
MEFEEKQKAMDSLKENILRCAGFPSMMIIFSMNAFRNQNELTELNKDVNVQPNNTTKLGFRVTLSQTPPHHCDLNACTRSKFY